MGMHRSLNSSRPNNLSTSLCLLRNLFHRRDSHPPRLAGNHEIVMSHKAWKAKKDSRSRFLT